MLLGWEMRELVRMKVMTVCNQMQGLMTGWFIGIITVAHDLSFMLPRGVVCLESQYESWDAWCFT